MGNREDSKSESAKNTESKKNEKGNIFEGSRTRIVRDREVQGGVGFILEGLGGFFYWRQKSKRRRKEGFGEKRL